MNIPTIGVVRGLFDVFVPGTFLLLNLILVVCLLPYADTDTSDYIKQLASDSGMILLVALCFGYLLGILLRMLHTELPDKWSAAWNRRFNPRARNESGDYLLWATEEFPYIGWIGRVCKRYLPPEMLEFYSKTWAPRNRVGHTEKQNRQFFNYCKTMVNSVDERSATEFNAAEALSRYIAAMFFALLVSSILIVATTVLYVVDTHTVLVGPIALLIVYAIAMWVILNHLRFLRIKEVEIVFVACYINKEIFEEKKPSKKVAPRSLLDCLFELLGLRTSE
jgi:hypothetical protein